MNTVTNEEDMLKLMNDAFYDDAVEVVGHFNYTLELLDHVGSCAYSLYDAESRGEECSDESYLDASGHFFESLDTLNANYGTWRDRVVSGIHIEYDKLNALIPYRDMIRACVDEVYDQLSADDYKEILYLLNYSGSHVYEDIVRIYRDTALKYVEILDVTLDKFNEFGVLRDRDNTARFDYELIEGFDRTFYEELELFNPLVMFANLIGRVTSNVTNVKNTLEIVYRIYID